MPLFPVRVFDGHGHILREISSQNLQLRNDRILRKEINISKYPIPGKTKSSVEQNKKRIYCVSCGKKSKKIRREIPKVCETCLDVVFR